MWKKKEEEKIKLNDDDSVETEWDEILASATEEDLVDLAGKFVECKRNNEQRN